MPLPRPAFKPDGDGVRLVCRVQPGASRSAVVGAYGPDAVKIALAAPPVDGKANAALCRMLAELCGIPKSKVAIASGHASRSKVVRIAGLSAGELMELLEKGMS